MALFKELFNQATTTSPDNADRVAMGQPATEGAKNITWSNFLLAIKSYLTAFFSLFETASSGTYNVPALTHTGVHEITLAGDGIVNFYTAADAKSKIVQLTVPTKVLTLTNGAVNYVYADYNAGTPQYLVTTNPSIFTTDGRKRGVYRIIDENDTLYTLSYNEWGVAQSDKSWAKDVALRGIERQSGLLLSTAATRISTIGTGLLWFSDYIITKAAQNVAGTTGSLFAYYPVASVFTKSANLTSYDATYYSNGIDRLTMDNNKFGALYFWVNAAAENEVYFVYGNQYTSEAEAIAEETPLAPSIMTSHSYALAQKIVRQKNSTNGTVYATSKGGGGGTGITSHNQLNDRDVAGNHAKIIPIIDSTEAFKIMAANDTDKLMIADTTNKTIKVLDKLEITSNNVEAAAPDSVSQIKIKGTDNIGSEINLIITGEPVSLGKKWVVKDEYANPVTWFDLFHDDDTGELKMQVYKPLWLGSGDYSGAGNTAYDLFAGSAPIKAAIGIISDNYLKVGTQVNYTNSNTSIGVLIADEYGWKDLVGSFSPRNTGVNAPTQAAFRGNIWGFAYSANDFGFGGYHFTHDYKSATDIFGHVHWKHNGTAISGNIVCMLYMTYCKGYNQSGQTFGVEVAIPIVYNTTNIATTPQYAHIINEVQVSAPGGVIASAVNISITSGTNILTSASALFASTDVGRTVKIIGAGPAGGNIDVTITAFTSSTQVSLSGNASTTVTTQPNFRYRVLDTNSLEPDGILDCTTTLITMPTITGGTTNEPFIIITDFHYQTTQLPTKNRNYPFYT